MRRFVISRRTPQRPTLVANAPAHGRTARLYALIARARRVGVVFRRGPSKQVRLIRWSLSNDRFQPGQWLKAHVYVERCDLSPDGELLCYFAGNYRAPYATWTAISRPPYFTALALWAKGDAWGGGGLFDSRMRLRLNHRPEPYHHRDEIALAEGFRLPKRFVVEPLGEHAGLGEDNSIRGMRLRRDGWLFVQGPQGKRWAFDAPVGLTTEAPEIVAKPMNTRAGLQYTLRVACHGAYERDGRASVETAELVGPGPTQSILRELGRVDWADLDHNGDVLWAWAGKLWRLPRPKRVADFATAAPRLLADFNDMRFEAIAPPASTKRW
jgi:hypothetical protein